MIESKTHPGPVALVTGASRGIGAATALALARAGVMPVLAVRNVGQAAPLERQLRDIGSTSMVVECDVGDFDSVDRAVGRIESELGRLDIVVNNAAQIEPQVELANGDPQSWARAVQVNLTGSYFVVRRAIGPLLAARGTVINLSSGAAHAPRRGWSAYCATKAGLAMLTRSIALEYGEQGLMSYGLQPGLVDTEMQVRIRHEGVNEISQIARERLIDPAVPADAIAWLATRRPPSLSGTDMTLAELDRARESD